MKSISSRSNPWFKTMRQNIRQAGRERAQGGVWLEGIHLCQEYLERVGPPIWAIFSHETLTPNLERLRQAVPHDSVRLLPPDMLAQLGDIAGAQGVGFWVKQPQVALPEQLSGDWVLLDRLQDPGNVGSILRTCAAAGVHQVGLIQGSAAAWSPKVLRAAQGAHFALQIVENLSADWVLQHLQVPLCVTTLEEGANLYQQTLSAPRAWLFGHEGQGVEAHWLERAEQRVFIPQEPLVESLNVAAAVAVCLFEQRRQRQKFSETTPETAS